ncbi:MAG TPA: ABC-F family ATP-binding cassette domain-containing protein [Verrucomicrobiae bacterium]
MISIVDVSKSFGGKDLLQGASLQVSRGDRIGLVGPNGAGKSTLINMILGREEPDEGEITRDRRCSLGFLPQETAPVNDETVIEIAINLHPEIISTRRALNSDDHHHEVDPHSHYAELNGFELEARAKKILAGLGFRERDFERPARELSGGWAMRAHLARLLVQEPDFLLLDEPTNHLDLHSLLWFQNHLQNYPGAILMVSHDREFLNKIVDSIVELRFGQLQRYRGDYESFVTQREANEANLLAAYNNQQREIARLMLFVDRFRAKNTKAAQAQSKLKQIERMDKIEAPAAAGATINFSFPQPRRSGQRVLTLKDIHFGYGANIVYAGLDFEVEREQRIVLVGPNGAGKSTLLKLMAGILTPSDGQRELGINTICGYYSQNRVEMLRLDRTVFEEALDTEQRVTEQFIRTLLGCFLFSGDDVDKPVRVLSGGEKSRLALVKLLINPPNFLLMDEPTTHLDMPSIEALVTALKQFKGTLVFISHDVYFIKKLANQVVHVEGGQVRRFAGDYNYYVEKTGWGTATSFTAVAPTPPRKVAPTINSKEQRRIEAEQRQARSRARKDQQNTVTRIEKEIATLESRQQEIHDSLQSAETYANTALFAELNRELKSIDTKLDRLHQQWEAESLKLEQLA